MFCSNNVLLLGRSKSSECQGVGKVGGLVIRGGMSDKGLGGGKMKGRGVFGGRGCNNLKI